MRFLQLTMSAAPRSGPPDPEQIAKMRQSISDHVASGKLIATGGLTKREVGAARITRQDGKITVDDPPAGDGWLAAGGYSLYEAGSKEEAIARAKATLDVMGDGVVELIQVSEMYPRPKSEGE